MSFKRLLKYYFLVCRSESFKYTIIDVMLQNETDQMTEAVDSIVE